MNENQTEIIEMNLKKLKDSNSNQKSISLKAFSSLILNSRNQTANFIENVLNQLQQCLTISENQVNINATNLIEQIIATYQKEQIYDIIKNKLIKQLVKNLGQSKMLLRKLSHKCLLEFVKKYSDYQTLIFHYLNQGILNKQNQQLKQKCLNSFQSILILQHQNFNFGSKSTKTIFENIIDTLLIDEESQDVLKAATQCMTTIFRLKGTNTLMNLLSKQYEQKLQQLTNEFPNLAQIANQNQNEIYKKDEDKKQKQDFKYSVNNIVANNALALLNGQKSKTNKDKSNQNMESTNKIEKQIDQQSNIIKNQQKSLSQQLAEAQQMLKRMQQYKNDIAMIDEIFQYIPTLKNNFNDQRPQLFNISLKIMQVILQIKICDDKLYITVVPSIVERLNDQKFMIRNSINKVIKQFLKNYTKLWTANFFQNLQKAITFKYKQELINLLIFAYQMYSPIQFNQLSAITILIKLIQNKRINLKSKAIQCIQLILKQSNSTQLQNSLRDILSTELYELIIGKPEVQTPKFHFRDQNSEEIIPPQTQDVNYLNKKQRRLNTQFSKKNSETKDQQRYQSIRRTERIVTQIQSSSRKLFKKHQSMEENQKNYRPQTQNSVEQTNKNNSPPHRIRIGSVSSPKKTQSKLFKDSEGVDYTSKECLPIISDPKKQFQNLIPKLNDRSWKIQFSALNFTRSLIEHNQDIIYENITEILKEVLQGVLSLRSSIAKNSLICLDQLINKFKRKLDIHIDIILQKILKKTLYVNQFLQQEVKKCLISIANNLNQTKLCNLLMHHKQNKSANMKFNILIIIQNMIKNQKAYKKQSETIWNILLSFKDQPSIEIRQLTKKIINYIMETYPDWKQNLQKNNLKKDIQKIQEVQKKIKMPKIHDKKDKLVLYEKINIQAQDMPIIKRSMKQDRLIQSPKKYTAAIGAGMNQFARFEQLQKGSKNFKDWRHRINCMIEIFKIAFRYSKEFCEYSGSARYIILLCEQMQDSNTKICINALNILQQSIIMLTPLIEEYLIHILSRIINGMSCKKSEYSNKCHEIYKKLKQNIDNNKIVKQLLKLCLNPLQRTKVNSLKQLYQLLYTFNNQSLNILGPIIMKIMQKLLNQQKNFQVLEKIKLIINSINHLLYNINHK